MTVAVSKSVAKSSASRFFEVKYLVQYLPVVMEYKYSGAPEYGNCSCNTSNVILEYRYYQYCTHSMIHVYTVVHMINISVYVYILSPSLYWSTCII